MRFIDDGPDIPDELLWAQDEGQVVFFCGAGVSRARASLPDFKTLTSDVLDRLGANQESAARRLFQAADTLEKNHNHSGVVTSDRVFGLLEREFTPDLIEASVSAALVPEEDVDLSAHRTLIRLSTQPSGHTRIVTTNFDRLFEASKRGLKTATRSNLPHIAFNEADWGVVHLHGVVDKEYSKATEDGFVLSSSEFGDAYLAAGWAREFVKNVLDRHVAVFVGYSADDPPIRYLLEGLNQSDGPQRRAYAFQNAREKHAIAEWDQKGVQPILYATEEQCGHRTLWESLELWAKRSLNPAVWRDRTLKIAARGPRKLSPIQRGAVAHVVRSIAGAKAFAQFDPPPPSEWLCVFDPVVRYGEPRPEDGSYGKTKTVNPFDLYKIDSDHPPTEKQQSGMQTGRVPPETWDAFAPTPDDLRAVAKDNVSYLRGYYSSNLPNLPRRIDYLADWISRVASQPACVWWAGQQGGLHGRIVDHLEYHLRRKGSDEIHPAIVDAWRAIREFHALKSDKDRAYELKLHVGRTGWHEALAEEYADLFRPGLELSGLHRRPIPPKLTKALKRSDLIEVDVTYSEGIRTVEVPDEYLLPILGKLKSGLDLACDLEKRYSHWLDICSIEPDEPREDEGDSSFQRTYKLAGHVVHFANLFRRLAELSPEEALSELRSWPTQARVWERLRVWAYGNTQAAPGNEFADILLALSVDAFWPFKGERDLLLGLSKRWNEIDECRRAEIETRLLAGPEKLKRGSMAENKAYVARSILARLVWLDSQGCAFSFDLAKAVARLKKEAPNWKDEYAQNAARAHDGGGGTVRVDTDCSVLEGVASAEIIPTILGMERRPFNKHVEYQPFSGLSASDPPRALEALLARLSAGHFDEEFWDKFLRLDHRKDDELTFTAQIVDALCGLSPEQFKQISHSASSWFEAIGPELVSHSPKSYEQLWRLFLRTLASEEASRSSSLADTGRRRDWGSSAMNSAAGKIAVLLLNSLGQERFKENEGLPESWKRSAEELLNLPQPVRGFCICVFSRKLRRLYFIDSEWTEKQLLSVLSEEHLDVSDVEAFWDGFFLMWAVPQLPLFGVLRPCLEKFVCDQADDDRRDAEVLAVTFLSYWKLLEDGERVVSSGDLRSLILEGSPSFQSNVLWKIDRFSRKEDEWADDVINFLSEVWPKQKSLRTSKMSARLVELALAQKNRFPEIAALVSTLVTKVGDEHIMIPELRKNDETIAGQHPEAMLGLLYAFLPDDRSRWPYGAETALATLADTEPKLRSDPRYIELSQRT